MRDIILETTFTFPFTSRQFSDGEPTVLAGSPVLSVKEGDNATPITAGVSLTVDAAGVVGMNEGKVVATAANGYEVGKSYSVYISTGTVGGATVVGEVVHEFTIELSAVAADAAVSIAAAVWNRVINQANHNIGNSAGRILRLLQESGDYALGAVWLDTVDGTAGTDDFEHGTVNNPTNLIASALTLAASLNLHRIAVIGGSTVALGAPVQKMEMLGIGRWTLDLDTRDIAGSVFRNADVTGIATGTGKQVFDGCFMNGVTLPADTHVLNSGIVGTQTLPAGDIFYDSCHSAIAGLSAPIFDLGGAVGNTHLNIRHYSGGVDLRNHGATGADLTSIEGDGQIIINVNCTGGTIVIRGNFKLTNNGSATIDDEGNMNATIIAGEFATYDGPTEAEMNTAHGLLATEAKQDLQDAIITEARLAELDAANLPTDIAAIFTRLGAPAGATTAADIAALKAIADAIKAKTDNQPAGVPKNVALSNFMFLMVDATDFATPEIGLAVTAEISKDGAAFGAATNAVVEISDGFYKINLTAGEMNADTIALKFTAAGAMQRGVVLVTSA